MNGGGWDCRQHERDHGGSPRQPLSPGDSQSFTYVSYLCPFTHRCKTREWETYCVLGFHGSCPCLLYLGPGLLHLSVCLARGGQCRAQPCSGDHVQ